MQWCLINDYISIQCSHEIKGRDVPKPILNCYYALLYFLNEKWSTDGRGSDFLSSLWAVCGSSHLAYVRM